MMNATQSIGWPSVALSQSARSFRRVAAIDLFRGGIMVLMALDHTRDFFTDLPFEPEVLGQTNLVLFGTRWVTHFCAPMFFFLAGVSAFLYGQDKSPRERMQFLWRRGLWLVLLEFTLVGTAWTFQFPWGFFGVIWALGASMLLLALIVRLPLGWIAVLAVTLIVGHNALDSISSHDWGNLTWLARLLHGRGEIVLPWGAHQFVLFPLIPLVGVMAAGYVCGQLYRLDSSRRRAFLRWLGLGLTCAFVALRGSNLYGNPPPGLGGVSQGDWHPQGSLDKSLILFLDVEKYPPSLQFLLMTIGPSLLLLSWLDGNPLRSQATAILRVFGRVPLLFYVLHLYLIHCLAIVVAAATGQPVRWLFHGAIFTDSPPGYGHGLAFVYAMWLVVIALLYYPCRWFAGLKDRRRDWWLSYL